MKSIISFETSDNPAQTAYNLQHAIFDYAVTMLKYHDDEQTKSMEKLNETSINDAETFVDSLKNSIDGAAKHAAGIGIWSTVANIYRAFFFSMHASNVDMIEELSKHAMDVSHRALEEIKAKDNDGN
jgi:hypothetical protein